MLSPEIVESLAAELYQARKTRTQLRHFSRRHPEMTIEDGYAIQRAWVQRELADGRRIRGRKIGLTSRAGLLQLGVEQDDYGELLDDMAPCDGEEVAPGRML